MMSLRRTLREEISRVNESPPDVLVPLGTEWAMEQSGAASWETLWMIDGPLGTSIPKFPVVEHLNDPGQNGTE